MVLQNNRLPRSHILYPLIRKLNIEFGSSTNVRLVTSRYNQDETERKIPCKEYIIEDSLEATINESLKTKQVPSSEDDDADADEVTKAKFLKKKEETAPEFKPTWIVDLSCYQYGEVDSEHVKSVSYIAKQMNAK